MSMRYASYALLHCSIRLYSQVAPASTTPTAASLSPASSSVTKHRLPVRGGQNLTDRHERLAKSIRSKGALSRHIDELPATLTTDTAGELNLPRTTIGGLGKQPEVFMGLAVPQKPVPPSPEG